MSAITHIAPVEKIESSGDGGKYKLIFSGAASTITPIPYDDAPKGFLPGTRYTDSLSLQKASKLSDIL